MILPTDIPTRVQLERLLDAREPSSVSIYLPTSPSSRGDAERIELKNRAAEAARQLAEAGTARSDIAAIEDELADLIDDDEFWRYQARSLAVLMTPKGASTFRLPNSLSALVEVSDRFCLKPLLRAVTFPHTAFVLAVSQNGVRLLEIAPDLEPAEIRVPDLPRDVASAVGKSSIRDRAPSGRIQGSEGQKARIRQYARQIDQALRPLLSGLDLPLILAAAEPIDSIYRPVNSYPHLLAAGLPGSPETSSAAELTEGACRLLDDVYAAELRTIRETYDLRVSQRRASGDIADVAAPPALVSSTPCWWTSTRSCPAVSTRRPVPSPSTTPTTRSTTALSTRSPAASGCTAAGCWPSAALTFQATARSRRSCATRPEQVAARPVRAVFCVSP